MKVKSTVGGDVPAIGSSRDPRPRIQSQHEMETVGLSPPKLVFINGSGNALHASDRSAATISQCLVRRKRLKRRCDSHMTGKVKIRHD